jgi:cyclopropane fatty-acyl-phospholipid synthase-like methyltransferase
VLDLGCGLGGLSFYFANKGAQVVGVDVSNLAVTAAQEIASSKKLDVDFRVADVARSDENLGKFDLIFDSHLFHCLVSGEDRQKYFDFAKRHMGPETLFMLETMIFHKQFRTPVGYSVDEEFVLYKEVGRDEVPIRKIIPGIDLEEEVKNSGLDIHYLYYHAELSFDVFDEYSEYPRQNLPQTARLAAKLKT